eukprot:363826-Chlamydomonas_euryale.AAC.7
MQLLPACRLCMRAVNNRAPSAWLMADAACKGARPSSDSHALWLVHAKAHVRPRTRMRCGLFMQGARPSSDSHARGLCTHPRARQVPEAAVTEPAAAP